ncbi:hypothetical protein J2795_001731 [Chryseobacterium bernardetii]|jgi:hypothetical protein|uniref:Uncharacterized protein n=3 Tax=Chryseobacterium TaxID=59732 RepID=A0A543EI81_9FLAO|nr:MULTISPECIES: hypothetical protein [Chryseobacterium]MDR6371223.1 hypothetical protein [Chryseobacterium vietnamense]MDR6441031.1 hypothetical protein [Chryseobacterium bernardetii]MDR6457755.1 hypothetical protein [Chryseobacterium vietnamense]MDR6486464.1 hypothetical protein [Chryseobacterium vietnamense]TQM21292.1 hypothetical protein FB551_0976 [Chryseobacterium aquifrigidense]
MRTLLFPILLISVAFSAQKTENVIPVPKIDTTKIVSKIKFPGYFAVKPEHSQKELYKILTVKPKDTALYLALKEPSKDYSQYKILNSITPDKLQVSRKKIMPSK